MLCGHGAPAAIFPDWAGDLAGHFARASAFFTRISEHTQPLEPGALNEIEQGLEGCFRFARKSHDEGGAQGNSGNASPDAIDQIDNVSPEISPPHPFQHVFVNMLQWH